MITSTTTRDFLRNFAQMKKVASNGGEIVVRDRSGETFVFKAAGEGPSLGSRLSDLCGALETGVARKSLAGFGRNRG